MKHATEPFDDPSANAILRSADGVDFRVVKRIISGMSHVFTQLFERGFLFFPPFFFQKPA